MTSPRTAEEGASRSYSVALVCWFYMICFMVACLAWVSTLSFYSVGYLLLPVPATCTNFSLVNLVLPRTRASSRGIHSTAGY